MESFIRKNPKGVVTQEVLNKHDAQIDKTKFRHAVVIVGEADEYYKVKNSYGPDFADQGFFRIGKYAIINGKGDDEMQFAYLEHNEFSYTDKDLEKWNSPETKQEQRDEHR